MGLAEYKRKRHFSRTPEPAGTVAWQKGRSFVVQKHAASHLHYDFRLEYAGVLKSWAVPKGPSLDPAHKRLAVQTEDHPIEYGSFEGVIPQGEYGGGTVMLWDRGHWEPDGDARAAFRRGRVKFKLNGEKLRGGWMLVRTGDRTAPKAERSGWLLIKERDEEAVDSEERDVREEFPLSVATGRTLDEIATGKRVRRAGRSKNGAARSRTGKAGRTSASRARTSAGKPGRTRRPAPSEYDATREQFAGVRLTSQDKVLYPEGQITKLDLARYYQAVAPWMLPHIVKRPLVLVRCPEGRRKACFYQKHPPTGTPDTLRQVPIREKSKTEPYIVVDDIDGLISLAQIGALEIHGWGSREDMLERPDRLVFDLDPDPTVQWSVVVDSARQVRQFLADLGLVSFVKTTGGKGLHLVVPIDRRHEWDEAKAFCKQVAETIVRASPNRYTSNMSKAARQGKISIDYLRNGRGATAVLPYSTRSHPFAPVSTPLAWEELTAKARSDHYTVANLPARLAALKRDPWEEIDRVRQGIAKAARLLAQFAES